MAGPWEQYQQADAGPWQEFQPQGATSGDTMAQAKSRQLPPTWDVSVGGESLRGVLDPEAGAYLVSRDGGRTTAYINKNADGSLGLKPYRANVNAAGTSGENFAAGMGKAAVDTKRGIQQLGALAGNTLGLVDDATVDATMADANAVQARDADLMDTGAGFAGNVAGNIATTMLGGSLLKGAGQGLGAIGKAAAARGAGTAGTVASVTGNSLSKAGGAIQAPKTLKQAGAAGAAMGAMQPAGSLDEKGVQVSGGAAAGALGQGAANTLGRAAKGASDLIPAEVKALAKTAKDKWGISVRADQVLNSKPLNAASAALDYVPLSGAGASKVNLQKQFNAALAKSIGQTSDNPARALQHADTALGNEFDRVLRGTAVQADNAFQTDLAKVMGEARNEMTDAQFGVMQRQVDNILSKVGAGDVIDAQAAYNIKKGLDRLGKNQDSTLGNYATDMKRALLEALNRSLGPEEAAKFAATRGQYSNLLNLQKIVPRGAESDISPAKLANLRGYMTPDLNELADIAATFLKGRVGDSGTAQRGAVYASIPAAMVDPVTTALAYGGGATIGRGANMLLDSPAAARYLMDGSKTAGRVAPIGRVAPASLPAFLESYLSSQ